MTSVLKNVYIDKLVNKYNNTYDSTIKMKPVDVIYVINDFKGEEIVRIFFKKEQQKTIQKEFRIEKVIKTKSDKLCVTWKGYDNSLISQIDKRDIIII